MSSSVGLCGFALLFAAPQPAGREPPCVAVEEPIQIDVIAGTRLFSKPNHGSIPLYLFDFDATVRVSARCGDWLEVAHAGLRAYMLPGDAFIPPLDKGRTVVVGATAAEEDRKVAALRAMSATMGRTLSLGPWPAISDSPTSAIEPLSRVAKHVPRAFGERFGVRPGPVDRQLVVVFSELSGYRAFLEGGGYARPGPARSGGVDPAARSHTEGVVAAICVADGPKIARVHLVHELTHLLQRRSFPGPLPRWLAEGMAEDLAWSRVDGDGTLILGSVEGIQFMNGGVRISMDTRGPGSTIADYARALEGAWPASERAVPTLQALFSNPPDLGAVHRAFGLGGERRTVAAAGLFVRFLLGGASGMGRSADFGTHRRRGAFLGFLTSIASGGPSDADALLNALGVGVETLQKDFDEWVREAIAPNH